MSDESTPVPPAVAERSIPPDMMPGGRGGLLRRGGGNPKNNGGRTPNIIREGLRKNLLATARRMEQTVRNIAEVIERRKARYLKQAELKPEDVALAEDYDRRTLDDQERLLSAQKTLSDFLAKYGIGMTFTETNSQGDDVPRPVIYLPSNGRGNTDN